jgi:hypothetical protein
MDTFLLVLAFALAIAGFLGSFLPLLPGPPLAFLGLVLLIFSDTHQPGGTTLLAHLVAVGIIAGLDYYIPVLGTKIMGGSQAGTRGAIAGLCIGLFFGLPGILLGPFLGSLAGELINGSPGPIALKAAFGAFLGFLAGTFIKMAYVLLVIWQLFQLW